MQEKSQSSWTNIAVALIGAVALVIVAIINVWKDLTVPQIPILATQTAEARLTQIATNTLAVRLLANTGTPSANLLLVTPTITPRPPTLTPIPTPAPTLGIGSTKISPIDGARMMYVPAGEFTMGSTSGNEDETPVHTVYLDAFWIDKFEVTNALFRKCVNARKCQWPSLPSNFPRELYFVDYQFDNYPVILISWDDAKVYCEWRENRLPTEAEWEKAARGTDIRTFPWGNTFDARKLNSSEGGAGATTTAGSYPDGASPYGVMDMAGNVWEWVVDWYDNTYYRNSLLRNPGGLSHGQHKVLRGGSWGNNQYNARAADRNLAVPDFQEINVGFRCVQSFSP